MASSASERSEKPTARRLRDARRKGQVAVSRDLATAAGFASALGTLVALLPEARLQLAACVLQSVERAGSGADLEIATASSAVGSAVWMILSISLPVGAAAIAGSAGVSLMQTQGLVSGESLSPKPERFNPVAGLKRLVAARTLVEFAKSWVKVVAVGSAAILAVASEGLSALVNSSWTEPGDAMLVGARISMTVALAVAGASLAIGGADVLLQRWLHARDLRMTKDEVRRDQKEEDGDPHIKHVRKQIHRELALPTMLHRTRTASFVAVNPTHLAVAVVYRDDSDEAPRIVAKGAGEIARRLRREAERYGVRVVRNKPLARALFAVPVDAEIPEELYLAVAETLTFIAEAAAGRESNVANEADVANEARV
ncbi:MAG: EscU/YscU/HrcU family type III secretion system export apparatus switch protein [Blastocatellia bacterium]|nr:EscU/YscU/HrcU family type III secretion system export apparatus switch protein [Blastocatellia bacterium]